MFAHAFMRDSHNAPLGKVWHPLGGISKRCDEQLLSNSRAPDVTCKYSVHYTAQRKIWTLLLYVVIFERKLFWFTKKNLKVFVITKNEWIWSINCRVGPFVVAGSTFVEYWLSSFSKRQRFFFCYYTDYVGHINQMR